MILNSFPMAPSVNQTYRFGKRRMYKSKEAVLFDRAVTLYFATMKEFIFGSFERDKKLRCSLEFHFEESKLFSKKRTIKRLDLDNRIKLTLDAISKHLNFNDCQIFELMVYKRLSFDDTNYTNVEILNL